MIIDFRNLRHVIVFYNLAQYYFRCYLKKLFDPNFRYWCVENFDDLNS